MFPHQLAHSLGAVAARLQRRRSSSGSSNTRVGVLPDGDGACAASMPGISIAGSTSSARPNTARSKPQYSAMVPVICPLRIDARRSMKAAGSSTAEKATSLMQLHG